VLINVSQELATSTFSAEEPSKRQVFFIEFSLAKSHNPSPPYPHMCHLFYVGLLFYPENEGTMFL
jgi:hypothetical protein